MGGLLKVKSGLWHFFDDNNELIKSEHYEKGSLVKETNLICMKCLKKLNFPDQCEWEIIKEDFIHSL